MLRLNLAKEPYWLEIDNGVSLLVRPLNTPVMNYAHTQSVEQMLALRQRQLAGDSSIADLDDQLIRDAYLQAALAEQLALVAIIDWKGVHNADGTELAKVTPETIRELMSIYFISEPFLEKYYGSLEDLAVEGNASRSAANGISAVGQPIAGDATTNSSLAAKESQTHQRENAAHT